MARIFFEDFETDGNGARYTTSVTEFTDGTGDFFIRTDESNIGSFYDVNSQSGDFYFAAMDLDGEGGPTNVSLKFNDIDIAGVTNLGFSGLFAEDDDGTNQDWDADSSVIVSVSIDNGAFEELLRFEAAGGTNTEPLLDTDGDGVGDGTALTSAFQQFQAGISGTGSLLDLRIDISGLNAGDEDIAIDAIEITGDTSSVQSDFTLELLHFADQEAGSAAIQDAPNLSAVLNALRAEDLGNDGVADNTLTLSSGDAFIPGVFFDAGASVFGQGGVADIQIQNELGVQAIALGNHEFDFGTRTLAGLIDGAAGGDILGSDFAGTTFPYLSANLDVSTDGNLAPLAAAGGQAPQGNVVAPSTVIDVNGELIGVVGATTPTLGSISSPGSVGISPTWAESNPTDAELDALANIIQSEVDTLLQANPTMNKVVLLAHMQQLDIELALAERLSNVDIIVAGGSNTRLFDKNDRARDGDSDQGDYPQFVTDADGKTTAVVNTDGSYKYVGRLVIDFDANGNVIAESFSADVSGAYATDDQGVADLGAANLVDPEIQTIVDLIETQIIQTESNVLGFSNVFLNGNRSGDGSEDDADGVRTQETNLGNLTSDANLAAAQEIDATVVASIKNGGGIRASIGETLVLPNSTEVTRLANPELVDGDNNVIKPEGGISQNDIQKVLAFNNGLTLLTLTKTELIAVLEHGVSALPGVSGRFAQVSGVEFSFDADQEVGSRIVDAAIVDESGATVTQLMQGGVLVGDATETFRITTLGFLAGPRFDENGNFTGGGDGYPFPNTNTDPTRGEVGDPAVIARVNLQSLEQEGVRTGEATFADDGTEQDALAEYLLDNHATQETAFEEADSGAGEDARIEQLAFVPDAPEANGELALTKVGTFETGIFNVSAAEVVDFDPATARAFVTNDDQKQVDVIDLSDPSNPFSVGALDPTSTLTDVDGISSVAASGGLVAVAVPGETSSAVAIYNAATLALVATVDVDFGPDMVTFTPDGSKILVAIEAEPGDVTDEPGGVVIIDTISFETTFAGFDAFDPVAGNLKVAGVRLFPENDDSVKVPSIDLEPEYIAVTADGTKAYVALQEANAIGVLDLETQEFADIMPLGVIDHSQPGFGIDASDRDDEINIANVPVFGMFMPDAIATYSVNGKNYIVTANEGDARAEDDRIKDLTLDPEAFPDAATLQQDEVIGRLQVSTIDGDFDSDGDFDALFSYGTRSFSIFDEDGLVFDSGEAFERIITEQAPDFFNGNNDDPSDFDTRSDNKGPEPEALALGQINGEWFAFIGMERATGIMVYNITDPEAPEFVQFIDNAAAGDLGPETMRFVSADESPNGTPLLLIANEVSGTTAVYAIDVAPQEVTIMEVQGADHRSPLEGQEVRLSGVVTAIDPGEGLFIQDRTGDGDASTSDAIFIDERTTDRVAVGDLVQVTGLVDERQFGNDLATTTLDHVRDITILESGVALPDAVVLGPNGILPPTGQIDDDGLTEFQPAEDGIDFFESLEGMLVMLEAGAAVIGSNQFGETFVTVNENDSGRSVNGGLLLGGANGSITNANPERIIIDDDIYSDSGRGDAQQDVPAAVTGDTIEAVTGVIDYSFGEFKLLATDAPVVIRGDTVEDVTTLRNEKEGDLTVATYNVLNLDPSDGDQFAQLAADIVSNLGAPMIIGLQEIQDNNGSINDGTVSADQTYQLLIDAIVDAGGPLYGFADSTPTDLADGGQPGANIRNGFLYQTDEVTLVSTERLEGDAFDPNGAFDADPTPGDGINEGFAGTRKPFVGVFEVDGEQVTIVNNHFKSKSGDDPLTGAVQPPVEVTEVQRVRQAEVVNTFVSGRLDADEDANVIVLGDLNDFEFSDPVLALAGDELTNLINELDSDDRYSFIFNGNSQTLDHILVSDALIGGAKVDAVHINADFPANDRASDHDPIVAKVNLLDIAGTDGDDLLRAEQGGGDILPGAGEDIVVLANAGGTTVVGTLADLAGDVIVGFTDVDSIVVTDQRLDAADISIDPDTSVLTLGSNTLELFGKELDEGALMVTREGNTSTISFIEAAPERGETVSLDPNEVNGVVNQAFLNGNNAQDFQVTLTEAGAGFNNLLGFYLTDDAGNIVRSEVLFDSLADASIGATADIEDVVEGQDIGFFLVQQGGLINFTGDIGVQEVNGELRATDGGVVLTDSVVFSSLSPELNPLDLVHAVSGATADGSALNVGFEDLVGGGDADYQDVTFAVSILNADPFAIV